MYGARLKAFKSGAGPCAGPTPTNPGSLQVLQWLNAFNPNKAACNSVYYLQDS